MHRITFTIGQGKDKHGKAIDGELIRLIAYKRIAAIFQGYTATIGHGGWIDTGRNLVEEETLVLTVVCGDNLLVRVDDVAESLRDLFRQECVMVTTEEVRARFV